MTFKSCTGWALLGSICMSLMLLVGCSSKAVTSATKDAQKKAPHWVTQPPQQSGTAYGIGSMEVYGNPADAVKRASELAKVDLVSQLKVTVEGSFSHSITETRGTNQNTQVQQNVSNYVRSQTPTAELDEVQVADTWVTEKLAYVLVELDRQQAAARLRRDVNDLDAELLKIAQLQPQGNKLQQLQPLLPALALLAKRESLSERLALVSVERRGALLPAELKDLQNRIYQQIDGLVVALEFTNNAAKQLEGGLLEALTTQGLRVQKNQATADLTFVVSAKQTKKQQGGNHYAFVDTQVVIKDSQQRVLNAFSKQARGVSGMSDMAQQKAAIETAKLITNELAVTLAEKLR